MDLGVASKAITNEKGVEAVEVELEDGVDVINRDYDEALQSLVMKPEAVREVYKNTRVLFYKHRCLTIIS